MGLRLLTPKNPSGLLPGRGRKNEVLKDPTELQSGIQLWLAPELQSTIGPRESGWIFPRFQ